MQLARPDPLAAVPDRYFRDVVTERCLETADQYIDDPIAKLAYAANLLRVDHYCRHRCARELRLMLDSPLLTHFATALGVTVHDFEITIAQRVLDAETGALPQ